MAVSLKMALEKFTLLLNFAYLKVATSSKVVFSKLMFLLLLT
mgnify:CR=1 FL=1